MRKDKSLLITGTFLLTTAGSIASSLIETPLERESGNDPVAPQMYVDNPLLDEFTAEKADPPKALRLLEKEDLAPPKMPMGQKSANEVSKELFLKDSEKELPLGLKIPKN